MSCKTKKISIVIPVYNTSKFLKDCIESLLTQTLSPCNYEIIFVDDGSTDDSRNIIAEYQKRHTNIIMLEQKNNGVSSARNAGLDIVSGQYLWFVDSDDFVAPYCIDRICELIDLHNPELIRISYTKVQEEQQFSTNQITSPLNYKIKKLPISGSSACNAIVRSDIVLHNNIRFNTDLKYGEDILFWYEVYIKLTGNTIICDSPIYFNRKRSGSAMQSKDVNSITRHTIDLLRIAKHYKDTYDGNSIIDKAKLENTKKRQHLSVMGALSILPKSNLDYNRTMSELKKEKLYPFPFIFWHVIETKGLKRKIVEFLKILFCFEPFYKLFFHFRKK